MKIEITHHEKLTLNYEVSGQGPDLMLVHGLGLSSMRTWIHQIPALEKKFRVHRYDVRGFGESDNPLKKFAVQQHVYDLNELLKALKLDKVILVGFSMGGWISLQYVLDFPQQVRAMVLSCTTSGLRPEGARRFVERGAKVEQVGTAPLADEQIRNTFCAETFKTNPELIRFYRENFLDPKHNDPKSYAAMFRSLSVPNVTPQLGRIQCPTLVMCGSADGGITRGNTPTDAAEVIAQGIPGARLEVIPDGGHYAHLEQPDIWNRIALQFLDQFA